MLRIALIGCGDHSRRFHAPSLLKYHQDHPGQIALAAACDIQLPKAQGFCEQFAFAKPYADYKAMPADESIDGCICPVADVLEASQVCFDLAEKLGAPGV